MDTRVHLMWLKRHIYLVVGNIARNYKIVDIHVDEFCNTHILSLCAVEARERDFN